jgi:hypothetical protein
VRNQQEFALQLFNFGGLAEAQVARGGQAHFLFLKPPVDFFLKFCVTETRLAGFRAFCIVSIIFAFIIGLTL